MRAKTTTARHKWRRAKKTTEGYVETSGARADASICRTCGCIERSERRPSRNIGASRGISVVSVPTWSLDGGATWSTERPKCWPARGGK